MSGLSSRTSITSTSAVISSQPHRRLEAQSTCRNTLPGPADPPPRLRSAALTSRRPGRSARRSATGPPPPRRSEGDSGHPVSSVKSSMSRSVTGGCDRQHRPPQPMTSSSSRASAEAPFRSIGDPRGTCRRPRACRRSADARSGRAPCDRGAEPSSDWTTTRFCACMARSPNVDRTAANASRGSVRRPSCGRTARGRRLVARLLEAELTDVSGHRRLRRSAALGRQGREQVVLRPDPSARDEAGDQPLALRLPERTRVRLHRTA